MLALGSRFGNTFVGSDNITLEGNGSAELGSWISKEHIGNAYADKGRKLTYYIESIETFLSSNSGSDSKLHKILF